MAVSMSQSGQSNVGQVRILKSSPAVIGRVFHNEKFCTNNFTGDHPNCSSSALFSLANRAPLRVVLNFLAGRGEGNFNIIVNFLSRNVGFSQKVDRMQCCPCCHQRVNYLVQVVFFFTDHADLSRCTSEGKKNHQTIYHHHQAPHHARTTFASCVVACVVTPRSLSVSHRLALCHSDAGNGHATCVQPA